MRVKDAKTMAPPLKEAILKRRFSALFHKNDLDAVRP